jgi:hypothetical protein
MAELRTEEELVEEERQLPAYRHWRRTGHCLRLAGVADPSG